MPPPAPKLNGETSSSAKRPSRNQLKRDKKKARKHTQPDGPTDSERETDAESSVAESEMDFELEVRLHHRLAELATRASVAVGGWELTTLCLLPSRATCRRSDALELNSGPRRHGPRGPKLRSVLCHLCALSA